jgi:hypothetical protein
VCISVTIQEFCGRAGYGKSPPVLEGAIVEQQIITHEELEVEGATEDDL